MTLDITNHSVIHVREKQATPLISINSATLEQLDTLPGIGPAVASRIIAYRNTTPFKTIEELKNVKGIGDKLFLKLKDVITL